MKPTNFKPLKQNLSKNNSLISETIFSILIFAIMLIIISNPQKYSEGTINGLNLFISKVLPGLFPFMFLTKLLTELGLVFKLTQKCSKVSTFLFGTPGVSFFAFFMSILSGYPIGAKIISELYQKGLINHLDAKKMSIFCTTSGPIFIIGTVGVGLFENYQIGLILYISHILSSIMLGILYNLLTLKPKIPQNTLPNSIQINTLKKENILSTCITDTINSLFMVGAYITIFYLIGELLDNFLIIKSISQILNFFLKPFDFSSLECESFVYGLLEVTRGCKLLSASNSMLPIALTCGIISFSGLSIIMQSMAFLKTAKIKMHSFIFSKLVHMIVSIFICYVILVVFL